MDSSSIKIEDDFEEKEEEVQENKLTLKKTLNCSFTQSSQIKGEVGEIQLKKITCPFRYSLFSILQKNVLKSIYTLKNKILQNCT